MLYTCPQCNQKLVGSQSRLVQDSCGHKKCRLCLVKDEDKCLQCLWDQQSNIICKAAPTGVITYNVNDGISRNETSDNQKSLAIGVNVNDNNDLNSNYEFKVQHKFQIPQKFNHISVNSDNPIIYTCTICNKHFKTRSHMKYHYYCAGGKNKF